jgi:hypothetical protein
MAKRVPPPANGQFGPVYDLNSAALQKFRRNGGDRQAYGAAVEAAVLASQRAALRGAGNSQPRPNCASGTWLSCGREISAAVRQQHRAALLAYPDRVRRARTDAEWQEMYDAAMAEKISRKA